MRFRGTGKQKKAGFQATAPPKAASALLRQKDPLNIHGPLYL